MQCRRSIASNSSVNQSILPSLTMELCKLVLQCLAALFLFMNLASQAAIPSLQYNFYEKSCPRAEEIVKEQVQDLYHEHGNTAVSWIRTIFHDCVVESCDASILLDNTATMMSEKVDERNFGMRNFKYIEAIKAALEAECPGVVSCADIVALAAREGVIMLGGPTISLRTGRYDSLAPSSPASVGDQLPLHNASVDAVLARFADMGIDAEAAVALLGAHSVGRTHCKNLVSRLYPTVDPTLDATYAEYLKGRCPSPYPDPEAVVYARNDRATPMKLDNSYYNNVIGHKGLLLVDQGLMEHHVTQPYVLAMAQDNGYFLQQFSRGLVLLSEHNPRSSENGNIRKSCRILNA